MPERNICELCEKQEATHVAHGAWAIARSDDKGDPIISTEQYFRSKEDKNGGLHLCGDCVQPFLEGA